MHDRSQGGQSVRVARNSITDGLPLTEQRKSRLTIPARNITRRRSRVAATDDPVFSFQMEIRTRDLTFHRSVVRSIIECMLVGSLRIRRWLRLFEPDIHY